MMKQVLVVEDEMKIARVVRDYLIDAGFDVIVASDGEAALASARGSKPDIVVLDLGLPGVDGLDVARELRGSSRVPIVMLTARGEETDRIVGLELGADDYVVKPFSPKELVARVRAVLRRSSTAEMLREQPIRVADVEIDPQRMRVTAGGRPVELTPTEFQLLATLTREPGRVFTRGHDVMEAADRVAAGDYETRVKERGSGEARRLGRAFNEMTERLGTNEARRRQLLADVAHELRTPLSSQPMSSPGEGSSVVPGRAGRRGA